MTQNSQANASLDNLKTLMDERAELTQSKKRIEGRIKELDTVLRPMLEGKGDIIHNGYSFSVTAVAGRVTYDTKRMIADMGEEVMDQYKKVGAPSTRFAVKAVNTL